MEKLVCLVLDRHLLVSGILQMKHTCKAWSGFHITQPLQCQLQASESQGRAGDSAVALLLEELPGLTPVAWNSATLDQAS